MTSALPLPGAALRRPPWLRSFTVLRTEVLAGLVVALALVPEAISFSIVAGVDPRVGLISSFVMGVTTSFVGGRPAMISAATGAVALVVAPLSHAHGVGYLIAAILLAGLLQIALGLLGVARLMRFVPRSVTTGFVNALAISIFLAQLPNLRGAGPTGYAVLAAGLVLLVVLPRFVKSIPAPLITVALLTVVTVLTHAGVRTVGDDGALPHTLPSLGLPDVPLTLDTLRTIAPFSVGVALVGLMESLMTAQLVDELTDTRSSKTRECVGQGTAQIVTGLFGGMGGCAVIGQTMINVKVSGARTRLSTFLAGALLLVLVVGFGDVVAQIPMAALVAVMFIVCHGAFDWHSIRPATLKAMPRSETAVMVVTVVIVLLTHNLAYGVLGGTLLACVLFARRVAHLVEVRGSGGAYTVHGQVFFASSGDLVTQFDYAGDPAEVSIDFSDAHVWDASSVAALDAVSRKYAEHGKHAEIVGMNPTTAAFYDRLAGRVSAD
ncbi:SulP family inorganic anion transporter [Kineococcus rhizosphaerae]|uniref:SulP family sulfate permease n=1 Tax=Kineococcus rhizosphaerae TaxID=559628 RepID=A0A2T0R5J5_9ACTN|nr:SulP family inorganic anion transporter [Kineococcus rhizosphaerae]PRY16029.1 SulP family sulfate permease [Kineococcus rhizosphaerae]